MMGKINFKKKGQLTHTVSKSKRATCDVLYSQELRMSLDEDNNNYSTLNILIIKRAIINSSISEPTNRTY